MHDWVLVSIFVEWEKGTVKILFDTHKHGVVELIASGLIKLSVPKLEEWGESESVNSFKGPIDLKTGNKSLVIEMQSGDSIELEALSFSLPTQNIPDQG